MKNKIIVLDKGFVEFLDKMGDDLTPANNARISTGSEAKSRKDDINLTRYLLRHKHTSPFELVQIKFKIKSPIFVNREFFRHRTLSFNEESGRFKKLDPDYYAPDESRIKKQSVFNKQGSGENFDFELAKNIVINFLEEQNKFEKKYAEYTDKYNMANEIARINMPLSHYSTFIVSGNLLNWFRFLQLRMSSNAQWEIREYANAISKIVQNKFPICYKAFEDYWLNAKSFSLNEMDILNQAIDKNKINELLALQTTLSKREIEELKEKLCL